MFMMSQFMKQKKMMRNKTLLLLEIRRCINSDVIKWEGSNRVMSKLLLIRKRLRRKVKKNEGIFFVQVDLFD